MENFTNQEYWNQYWDKEVREEINFYFADLLEQFKTNAGKTLDNDRILLS